MAESFKGKDITNKVIRRKKHQTTPENTDKKKNFYKKNRNKNNKHFKKTKATPTSLKELADYFNNHRHR